MFGYGDTDRLSREMKMRRVSRWLPLVMVVSLAGACAQSGADRPASTDMIDALREKVLLCWNPSDFAKRSDASKLNALVAFDLMRDGSIKGTPTITKSGGGEAANAFAAEAVRAIVGCAPYDHLPTEEYNAWRHIEISFRLYSH